MTEQTDPANAVDGGVDSIEPLLLASFRTMELTDDDASIREQRVNSGDDVIGVSVEPLCFRPNSDSNKERLREAWPIVKRSAEELGLSCSFDAVDSKVMVESPCSIDAKSMRKARHLFAFLCHTPVPASLVIEMALHGRQHDVIRLRTKEGGMCEKYGVKKKEFDKFWTGLESCLKELEDLTHCTLYLDRANLTAVGPSPRVRWVRDICKFSIMGKISPAHVIRVFDSKLRRTTMQGKDDTMTIQESNHKLNDPLQAVHSKCFRAISHKYRAKLKKSWPMVKASLEGIGYLCTMSEVNSTVLIVSPSLTDPDTKRKAKFLFKLLCKTPVPAHLAIGMALHDRQYDIIKFKKYGLGKHHQAAKKEFDEFWIGLESCLKELEDLTICSLYLNKATLTAVGPSPRVHWVRNICKFSIIGKISPADVIRVFDSKLRRKTMQGKDDTMTIVSSHFHILKQPESYHSVSDPSMMREKSDSGVLEQQESNHELNDPLQAVHSKCFRAISHKYRAKLKKSWPMVEASLEGIGYLCTMSEVNSTVLIVSPSLTDPDTKRKAKFLFKLLCKTPVPAHLAIGMALHDRQYGIIKFKKYGFGKHHQAAKKEFDEFWIGLESCLKELEDLTICSLYLNKATLTAVGPSPRVHWVRNICKFSIMGKISPADVIRVFDSKLRRTTMQGKDDTMAVVSNHFEVLNQPESYHLALILRGKSDFGVLGQQDSNHGVIDPLQAVHSKCFCAISPKNQAKLKKSWPMVESSLEGIGYLCTISEVNSTVLIVSPSLTDPDTKRKAKFLFKLLCKTPVPAHLAIDMALHDRQYDIIKFKKYGFFKHHQASKRRFHNLRKGLKRSLKEFQDLTHCTLFLTKHTLTAVGPSRRFRWVRIVLETCIKRNLDPHHAINWCIRKIDQRIARVRDLDLTNVESAGHLLNKDGGAEVVFSFLDVQATRMEESLTMVESSLEKYGISCTLNQIIHTVTVSTTEATKEYPDAFEKAKYLVQLLTMSSVPPSLALDLALNGEQHEFIMMGFNEGGLCWLYGIKKEQYLKRVKWLLRSAKEILKLTGCVRMFYSPSWQSVACLGPSCEGLRNFKKIVLRCIVENMNPAYLCKERVAKEAKECLDHNLQNT